MDFVQSNMLLLVGNFLPPLVKITAWKSSVFGVFLVRIFPHSYWIRRDTEYLSVFSPNGGKYGSENLWIRTLSTQWKLRISFVATWCRSGYMYTRIMKWNLTTWSINQMKNIQFQQYVFKALFLFCWHGDFSKYPQIDFAS